MFRPWSEFGDRIRIEGDPNDSDFPVLLEQAQDRKKVEGKRARDKIRPCFQFWEVIEMVRVVPEGLTAQHWEAEKVLQVRPALHAVLAQVAPKPQPGEGYPECAPEFETEEVDLQLHYRPVKGVIPELWVLLGYSPRAKTLFFAHQQRG